MTRARRSTGTKNAVKNAWKQLAEKLEFLSDGKKKLIPFILIRKIRIFSKRNQSKDFITFERLN